MRAPALAALLLLAAAPVAAQDVVYEPAILTQCLDAGVAEGGDCIGDAAAKCMQGPSGGTTVGMSECFRREGAQWDGLLNEAYGKVMAEAEKADAEMKELGSAAPPQAPPLRDMQRSWIAYRDAACLYEATRWGGGSGAGPAATGCTMELTARQALRLMGYADQQR